MSGYETFVDFIAHIYVDAAADCKAMVVSYQRTMLSNVFLHLSVTYFMYKQTH